MIPLCDFLQDKYIYIYIYIFYNYKYIIFLQDNL